MDYPEAARLAGELRTRHYRRRLRQVERRALRTRNGTRSDHVRGGAPPFIAARDAAQELTRHGGTDFALDREAMAYADDIEPGPVVFDHSDAVDAAHAGDIRAELEKVGMPIGHYDYLIAAQARRRGATLVTLNQREFARVPGLIATDWMT